jgi:opacity protein-like surface antigen
MMLRALGLALGLASTVLLAGVAPAAAWDADETFRQNTIVVSPEVAYGHQFNLEHKPGYTGVEFADIGVRFGWLPFKPLGSGPLHGAFEAALEPMYQQYVSPKEVYFAGLGMAYRYHFLALGRFVPYAELAAFAGGTNLKITEIRSSFTFLLYGGLGGEYFVSDRTALYAGYRYQHVSNGNTSKPNRGFESNVGVFGVSFYFE